VQDTGYLTSLSIDGEYTSDTLSERRGSILPASVSILMGGYWENRTGDPRGCFSRSHALKPNISYLLLPISIGYDDRWGMILVGGAGGEQLCGVVRSSISVIRQREQEVERGGALQASLKESESTPFTS
jgi:hypothetical protein